MTSLIVTNKYVGRRESGTAELGGYEGEGSESPTGPGTG